MDLKHVLYEAKDGIAKATINRPQALNALNAQVIEDLISICEHIRVTREARVLIITGAGEKAFVAGADIAEMRASDTRTCMRFLARGQQLTRMLEELPAIVIAAVNGFALGGGCELAMSCDLIYASEAAKFGQPEVNLGIIPGFGGTQRLARLIGRARAKELILTGDIISAQEAHVLGLVNKVVPASDLKETVEKVAGKIMSKGPLAIEQAKVAVNKGVDLDMDSGLEIEKWACLLTFGSKDKEEGMAAFIEKRKPNFKGEF
jgi:enoyl-CoA hydratase